MRCGALRCSTRRMRKRGDAREGPRGCLGSVPLLGPLRLADGRRYQGGEMDVPMRQHDAFDAASSPRDRVGHATRGHEVEYAVAVGEPPTIEQVIAGCVEGILGVVEAFRI